MAGKKQESGENDAFTSFVDILKEMLAAGYGFQEIIITLKELGLSEAEARLLVELNSERQIPLSSGKIDELVRKKLEKKIEALGERLNRKMQSRKRRKEKALEKIHDLAIAVAEKEAPDKKPAFERRYYNFVLLKNQLEIEKRELEAVLLEIASLKLSRSAKSNISSALRELKEL